MQLPDAAFQLILTFLTPDARLSLALSSKRMLTQVKPSLTPIFDARVSYQDYRKLLMYHAQPSSSKKKKSQPLLRRVTLFGQEYLSMASTRSLLDPRVFGLKYLKKDLDISESKVTLENEFGDLLVLQASLLEEVEPETDEEFKCLAEAHDLNTIDFTNPAMLLKRQQKLLDKLQTNRSKRQDTEDLAVLQYLKRPGEWVVILCHGGHFCFTSYSASGACLKHTTDHKYVSRKKQGGRQITKDGSSKIKSAGSQIRRANERIHQENINEILSENEGLLNSADLIFIVAPGLNRIILTKEPSPLAKHLAKVRSAGVSIGTANFGEAARVYELLSKVELCLAT